MNVLGISGFERHGAAAISRAGEVVAASAEESFVRIAGVGYGIHGRYPLSAIDACLTRAGLGHADIDRVVVVDERCDRGRTVNVGVVPDAHRALACGLGTLPHERVPPARAEAVAVGAVSGSDRLAVVVMSAARGEAIVFERRDGGWYAGAPVAGFPALCCAIRRIAQALGVGDDAPYAALERLGSGFPAAPVRFDSVITWHPSRGIAVREDEWDEQLRPVTHLSGADPFLSGRAQQERQAIAASFCARVQAIVADIACHVATLPGVASLGIAGDLMGHAGVVAAVVRATDGSALLPPVAHPSGQALGAALDGAGVGAPLRTLSLGPEFSESDIKATIENCRLDYVYEPDWSRLLGRISDMLSKGRVVAWFHGAMPFGPGTVATRSILCDPSNRYARENMNRFLRGVQADEPLPVAFGEEDALACVDLPPVPPFHIADAPVKPEWRDALRSAVDARGTVPAQIVTSEQGHALAALLTLHRRRTGVPGLIALPLSAAGEPCACTPRDAVRAFFSSAVDALVAERFLLMKDYWLLRSRAAS